MESRQPFLRAPLETLKITLKNTQVAVERELVAVSDQLTKKVTVLDDETVSNLILRAKKLRARLVELKQQHDDAVATITERIAFVHEHQAPHHSHGSPEYVATIDKLLKVDIVDHFLRNGLLNSALALVEQEHLEQLVDFSIMQQAIEISQSLEEKEVGKCLAWCLENRVYLRKTRNPLEFDVRLQQYLMLISKGRRFEAIAYSRKYLSKFVDTHFTVMSEMTLALFSQNSSIFDTEKVLDARWKSLQTDFMTTFLELHGKDPAVPLFETIGAGLSSLRTYSCDYDPDLAADAPASKRKAINVEQRCPCCSSELGPLAKKVPYAHHDKSVLDPDPVVLPNGRIHGVARLEAFSAKVNSEDGTVVDPVSMEIFRVDEMRKVFPT